MTNRIRLHSLTLAAALLAAVPATAFAAASARDAGEGSVEFSVDLPAGQAYVEVFVRHNGIQNIATNIAASAVDHGDGTATYRHLAGGYRAGDTIEYRFYSYLPRSPGVFSPGPVEHAWQTLTYAGAPTFVVADHTYSLGPQLDAAGAALDVEVSFATKSSVIQPVSVGWQLLRANPSPFTTPLLLRHADVLGVYVKPCDGGPWVALAGTPFVGSTPTETEANGALTWSFFFNGSLPGTRIDPRFECGGHDITISTLIGPQTLRTDTTTEFAYVVAHR
jgi:hypothetical protein